MSHRIGRAVPRPLVFSGLYLVFLSCFVATPLWNLLSGRIWKAAFLGGSLGLAWLWAAWGSGLAAAGTGDRAFRLRAPAAGEIRGFLLALAATAIVSFPALTASIAWRGDEDFHVSFAARLAALFRSHWPYLAGLGAYLVWSAFQEGRLGRVRAAGILMGIAFAFAGRAVHLDVYYVLRYPIFPKYATAFSVWLFSWLPTGFPPEPVYRLLPLIAGAGLAALVFHRLPRSPLPFRLAAAIGIGGLPLIRYYETLFYLEMPAVLGMAWVCFQSGPLLRADLKSLPGFPGWYALLLLGFMKETVLPFLAAFLCCRLLFRWRSLRRDPEPRKAWAREAMLAFCVLLPLLLYLFYRSRFAAVRGYQPALSNLADGRLLARMALSWWDDFGPLPALSLAGAWSLARRRKWPDLVFPCLSIAWTALFHFLDEKSYVGYSRFNLFLLPGLLVLAWQAMRSGAMRFPLPAYAGLALILVFDTLASPIHLDGSRRANWGVYGADVGEHSYPYRQALAWIARSHAHEKVWVTGLDYPYPLDFYRQGTSAPELAVVARPVDEGRTMDSLLARADSGGYAAVLYHLLGDTLPALADLHGFQEERVFRNQAHRLVLFSRR